MPGQSTSPVLLMLHLPALAAQAEAAAAAALGQAVQADQPGRRPQEALAAAAVLAPTRSGGMQGWAVQAVHTAAQQEEVCMAAAEAAEAQARLQVQAARAGQKQLVILPHVQTHLAEAVHLAKQAGTRHQGAKEMFQLMRVST
jgi:hypothetical protein